MKCKSILYSLYLAIGTLVLLVLIVTRVDSPLCKICAEHREVDKTFVPIVDENESQPTNKHDVMDHESVFSIDTEMEENSANHSFVGPVERQDSGNDAENIDMMRMHMYVAGMNLLSSTPSHESTPLYTIKTYIHFRFVNSPRD